MIRQALAILSIVALTVVAMPQEVVIVAKHAVSGGATPTKVQSVSWHCPTSVTSCTVNASNGGLATIGAGHFVVVNAHTGTVPTSVTSSPSATWAGTDVYGNISAFTICNSLAFTDVTINYPASTVGSLTVTEYSGVTTSSCVDKVAAVADCGSSTTWTTGSTGTVSQNSELLLAWGYVGSSTTPPTIDSPFAMVTAYGNSDDFTYTWIGNRIANTTPTSYTASGTVPTAATCWTNIMAVKGQ
jgi:hypothetical protein